MEESLNRFRVFIVENGSLDDAVDLCSSLGIDKDMIFIYEKLKIDDVRKIKDTSSIASEKSQAFVFGEIGFDAQNALLKMLEEHDEFRYFVFYKSEGLLDTIISRAQTVKSHKKLSVDDEMIEMVKNGKLGALIGRALEMHEWEKEKIVSVLETVSKELSYTEMFYKSEIINEEIIKLKKFNLNKKLFLFALFFKLSGGD